MSSGDIIWDKSLETLGIRLYVENLCGLSSIYTQYYSQKSRDFV
jgi:hypothetical protein